MRRKVKRAISIIRKMSLTALIAVAIPTGILAYASPDTDTTLKDNKVQTSTNSAMNDCRPAINIEQFTVGTVGATSIPVTTNLSNTTQTTSTTGITNTTTTLKDSGMNVVQSITNHNVYSEIGSVVPVGAEPNIVYKPHTGFIHTVDCYWVDNSCIDICCVCGIEYKICDECLQIANASVDTNSTSSSVNNTSEYNITDYDIELLRKIVSSEYGSDWVPVEEKAKVVAGVMNRVADERFPNTVYDVLTQPNQFTGFDPYKEYYISDSIIDAVDYYFEHEDEFGEYNSWTGDGTYNYFYYQ